MPNLLPEEIQTALGKSDFSLARRLLEQFVAKRGLLPEQLTRARQKLALVTCKDKEIQSEDALERALQTLSSEGLWQNSDPETLGLAGGIHKRLWEINGNAGELEESLRFYERRLAKWSLRRRLLPLMLRDYSLRCYVRARLSC